MAALLAVSAAPAAAEPAVGIVKGTKLLAGFDTSSPGTFTEIKPVTGLSPSEKLEDVDYRWHPNGALTPLPPPALYGLAVELGLEYKVRLYRIDIQTGAATPVGPAFGTLPSPGGNVFGVDFNPTADRVRVINDLDGNLRISPDSGALVGSDTNLNPSGNKVSGVAYDRVETLIPPIVPSNTTAFAIGTSPGSLYTLGGVNSAPSPNTGQLLNQKPLGVAVAPGSAAGFDISPAGSAYATLNVGGQVGLYSIDLGSGAATLVGQTAEPLSGFAIVPAATPKPAPAAVVPDRTPPTVTLDGVKGSLSLQAFLKGIQIKVLANEPASVHAELLAAAKSARLASFNLILASKSLGLGAGRRTLTLKPSGRLVGKPAKPFKVSLRVTATDAGGNAGTATKTITVKPAKKPKKR